MTISAQMLCKKGSVQAFNAKGESIVAEYRSKIKAWTVSFHGEIGCRLTDERTRSFPTAGMAAEYITANADAAKTQELKWWN